MEYPQPPHPSTLGRAIAQIPSIEVVHRVLPNYRTGGGRKLYILKRNAHWRHAPLAEIAWRLQLDEWLLGDYADI